MYKIVGGDNREYGPVSEEKVREWVAQGRANATTMLSQEGGPWRPLSSFPEFADALRTAAPPPIAGQQPVYASGAGVVGGQQSNSFAVAGLVFSILGAFCCCGPIGCLVGIILSVIGLSQINQNPQAYTTTKTIAWLGIIIGIVGIILNIVMYSLGAYEEIFEEIQRRSR